MQVRELPSYAARPEHQSEGEGLETYCVLTSIPAHIADEGATAPDAI